MLAFLHGGECIQTIKQSGYGYDYGYDLRDLVCTFMVARPASKAVSGEESDSHYPKRPIRIIRVESLNTKKLSDLSGIDVFVSRADADKEPSLVIANIIILSLVIDYPIENLACYLSDGGFLIRFNAVAERASFAWIWVPFYRKHKIEQMNLEACFG